VIEAIHQGVAADGSGRKAPVEAEIADRPWRADPADGLRPMRSIRASWTP
jgi:N-acetylneuraminate synthase